MGYAPGIPPETFTQISRVLASTQDHLYFSAWLPASSHETLWQYDGSQLTVLPDIVDPRTSTLIMPNDISDFTEFNGQLYFAAINRSIYDGFHLWRFDGQHFEMLPGIDDLRSNLVVRDNRLFVMAGETPKTYNLGGDPPVFFTDSWRRAELWSYDGQHAEQLTHAGIGPFAGYDGYSEVFDSGDGLLMALSTNLGREVWRYDGDELGLAANVNQIPQLNTVLPYADEGSNPGSFTLYRGDVYFIADDGLHGRGLWRLPHTAAVPEPPGTVLLVLAGLFACHIRQHLPPAIATRLSTPAESIVPTNRLTAQVPPSPFANTLATAGRDEPLSTDFASVRTRQLHAVQHN